MCTRPVDAWRLKTQYWIDSKKGPSLLFKNPCSTKFDHIPTPCRNCIRCIKNRTMGRALQLSCEQQTTEGSSYFITPTYDEQNIPQGYTLQKKHFVDFTKRLRIHAVRSNSPYKKSRFELCAEYGEKTFRPHGHYCLFNYEINDLDLWTSNNTYETYTSETINKIWGKGSVKIGELSTACCLYVAQHVDKKINNATPIHLRQFIYQHPHPLAGYVIPEPPDREIIDKSTGEIKIITGRIPEYSTRSNRPGIGYEWFKRFGLTDLIHDTLIGTDYQEHKPPEYFYNLIKKYDPQLHKKLSDARVQYAESHQKTHEQNAYQDKFDIVMLKEKTKRDIL